MSARAGQSIIYFSFCSTGRRRAAIVRGVGLRFRGTAGQAVAWYQARTELVSHYSIVEMLDAGESRPSGPDETSLRLHWTWYVYCRTSRTSILSAPSQGAYAEFGYHRREGQRAWIVGSTN